jgi:hypothetical protein
MDKHFAPANVLGDGVDDGFELADRNWRSIGNRNVDVVNAGIAPEHFLLAQRHDSGDAERIQSDQMFGIITSPEK